MKRILLAASALAMIAAPAAAQTYSGGASDSVVLSGSVAKACNIMGTGATIDLTPSLAINDQGFLTIPANQFTEVADLGAAFGDVWCNTKANVTMSGDLLSADGITSTANNYAGAGFTHKIAVGIFNLDVGGVAVPFINTGADQFSGSAQSVQHFAGPVTGSLRIFNDGSRRPIAGTYEATWTLTVAPAS